jgi:hypothetical protein
MKISWRRRKLWALNNNGEYVPTTWALRLVEPRRQI